MTDLIAALDAIRATKRALNRGSNASAIRQFAEEHAGPLEAALTAQAQEAEAELLAALPALQAVAARWDAVAHRWREVAEPLGWFPNSVPPNPIADAIAMMGMRLEQEATRPAPRQKRSGVLRD